MGNIDNNTIIGTCSVCNCIIRLAYRDKFHKVGYCTGCGLEYGNPDQHRYGLPQKVVTQVEMRRLLNETYGQLIQSHPRLQMAVLMKVMDRASIRMTGFGIKPFTVRQLRNWGYDLQTGYIVKLDTGEASL